MPYWPWRSAIRWQTPEEYGEAPAASPFAALESSIQRSKMSLLPPIDPRKSPKQERWLSPAKKRPALWPASQGGVVLLMGLAYECSAT